MKYAGLVALVLLLGSLGGCGGGGNNTTGKGGTGGAAGVGMGGNKTPTCPGSGGSTANCSQYVKDYETELPAAKKCNPQSLLNECTVGMPSSLTCSGGCDTFVATNSSSKLKAIYADWQNAGCDKLVRVVCECKAQPSGGSCSGIITAAQSSSEVAAAAIAPIGTTGMCTDSFGGPSPL